MRATAKINRDRATFRAIAAKCYTTTEIARVADVPEDTVAGWAKDPTFPVPFGQFPNSPLHGTRIWHEEEVLAWLEASEDKRHRDRREAAARWRQVKRSWE
jgi:hypothetical protein